MASFCNLANVLAAACCSLALSFSSASAQSGNDKQLLLVEIKCPADNKDRLEWIMRNALGGRHKVTVGYENGDASYLVISRVQPKSEPDRWFDWNFVTNDFLTKKDAENRADIRRSFETVADIFRNRADKELRRYCLSEPDERKNAFDEIEANRRKLGLR